MKLRLQLIQCVLLRDISMKKNIIFLLRLSVYKKPIKTRVKFFAVCLGASIRFYVTRLYDLKFTPKNAKVKERIQMNIFIK